MCYLQKSLYRILHDLAVNINFYEPRLGNGIKRAVGEKFIILPTLIS